MRIKVGDEFVGPLPSHTGLGDGPLSTMVAAAAHARQSGYRGPMVYELHEDDAKAYEVAIVKAAEQHENPFAERPAGPEGVPTHPLFMGYFMAHPVYSGAPFSRLVLGDRE